MRSHNPLREVPECWVMGQGAGVGAALAVDRGVAARAAPVAEMQAELRRQGAIVTPPESADQAELAATGSGVLGAGRAGN